MSPEERIALAQRIFDELMEATDDPIEATTVLGHVRFRVERAIASRAREDVLHDEEARMALRLRELREAGPIRTG